MEENGNEPPGLLGLECHLPKAAGNRVRHCQSALHCGGEGERRQLSLSSISACGDQGAF